MTSSFLDVFRARTSLPPVGARARSLFAAIVVVASGIGFVHAVDAATAPDPKAAVTLSKKVVPPLKAAGDAFNAKQFDVALTKLQEAEAVEGKTAYDQFRIEEFRAAVYVNQSTKYDEVLAIYEKHQALPREYFEPQVADVRLKAMTQLAFRIQAHDKVADYGKQWMATHPEDTGVLDLMARSTYIKKDYKAALDIVKTAIGVAETNGKTPDELWLQLVPSCASNLDDSAGTIAGYEKLVRYYPKPEHWSKTLETLLTIEKNDAAVLYILRLMADTGVLARPEYYLEYSQRAIDKAMPGEALAIIQAGFEKKVLGTVEKDKAQHQRALTTAQEKAKADRAQLPEIEKEVRASKATNGQLEAGLGLAYFSYQMYEQAVQMLEAGLAKGGLRNQEDYRMVLGIAYLRVGQKEKAREQFQKLAANSPLSRIGAFWVSRTYN
jgi:tetratricopeptide (TPR) repeat protein